MNDDYFTIQPAPKQEPAPLEPTEIFRGEFWSVYLEDETYILGYVSGELAGRFKRIAISQNEAEQLMAGAVTCESVLIQRGAS